jgi:hypothetical protein
MPNLRAASASLRLAFADRWSAGATMAMHRIDYTANIALAGSPLGSPGEIVQNDLDTQGIMGHAKRYFGNWHRVAPYAGAALGWVTIDTNVPTGPPVGYCWFDPWWGLRCDSVQPTHTTTELPSEFNKAMARRTGRDATLPTWELPRRSVDLLGPHGGEARLFVTRPKIAQTGWQRATGVREPSRNVLYDRRAAKIAQ